MTKFIAVIAKIVTVALKVPPNAWYPCFRLKETRRNNLYCALDTKSVKTLKRNNCEKKRDHSHSEMQKLITLSGWAMRKSN